MMRFAIHAGLATMVCATACAPALAAPSLDQQLDKVIKTKKVAAADVVKRTATPSSAWAVLATKKNALKAPSEYLVVRVRGDGTSELKLAPPPGARSGFDSVVSLEARDLDGDGSDDAALVVRWERDVTQSQACAGCAIKTIEDGDQLYLLGGSALGVGFTHLLAYKTSSDMVPEGNSSTKPDDEDVGYTWTVAGKPAVVSLKRGKATVSKVRTQGLLDPAKDPLLGDARDAPLTFK